MAYCCSSSIVSLLSLQEGGFIGADVRMLSVCLSDVCDCADCRTVHLQTMIRRDFLIRRRTPDGFVPKRYERLCNIYYSGRRQLIVSTHRGDHMSLCALCEKTHLTAGGVDDV